MLNGRTGRRHSSDAERREIAIDLKKERNEAVSRVRERTMRDESTFSDRETLADAQQSPLANRCDLSTFVSF